MHLRGTPRCCTGAHQEPAIKSDQQRWNRMLGFSSKYLNSCEQAPSRIVPHSKTRLRCFGSSYIFGAPAPALLASRAQELLQVDLVVPVLPAGPRQMTAYYSARGRDAHGTAVQVSLPAQEDGAGASWMAAAFQWACMESPLPPCCAPLHPAPDAFEMPCTHHCHHLAGKGGQCHTTRPISSRQGGQQALKVTIRLLHQSHCCPTLQPHTL